MAPSSTLVTLLAERAATQGEDRAYVFLSDRQDEETALTFGELHAAAGILAARLAACARPGDRALPRAAAGPRVRRSVLRVSNGTRHRRADDGAAPAEFARLQRHDRGELRTCCRT